MKIKRYFDIIFSLVALVILFPIVLISWLVLVFTTHTNGLFFQKRVGQFGKTFTIYKLQTIHPKTNRISIAGYCIRKYKFDEFPQFLNVLLGNMSIVGPRPDVPGYYDQLEGENRRILELKPGITSLASLKYYNEEAILGQQENPLLYNDTVIFPDKVKLNLEYYYNRSFLGDLWIIWRTVVGCRL
jgi:lipopolysaccharide/colanic/teichoic acid biosynthesis glycosyltransferase